MKYSPYFAELVNLHDVAVHQVRGQLRLVDEEAQEVGALGVVRMNDLEGDSLGEPLGTQLLGFVDRRHPAFRDLVDEAERAFVLDGFGVVHGRALWLSSSRAVVSSGGWGER